MTQKQLERAFIKQKTKEYLESGGDIVKYPEFNTGYVFNLNHQKSCVGSFLNSQSETVGKKYSLNV